MHKRTLRHLCRLQKELSSITGDRLHLGCGEMHLDGWTNMDKLSLPGVDVVADMDKKLPFPDNSFDYIYGRGSLEHAKDFNFTWAELYRILRPGGIAEFEVPHPSHAGYYCDPTHYRAFSVLSFDYYTEDWAFNFYTDIRVKVLKIKLFVETGRFEFLNIFSWLVNRSKTTQIIWERFCWYFPMAGIVFKLQSLKQKC